MSKNPLEGGAVPTLSVGLPVYNGADFLAEAIESILNERFTHLSCRFRTTHRPTRLGYLSLLRRGNSGRIMSEPAERGCGAQL